MQELILPVLSIIVSVAVSYGVMKTKVNMMEQKLEKFDKDHDLLVELNTKIDMLLKQGSKK